MKMSRVLDREERDQDRKNICRNNGQMLPLFGERHKFTDSRSLTKSKQDESKESGG